MQIYFKILMIIGGPLHCLSAKVQMKAIRWVAETAFTPVTWKEGEWPVFTNVSGHMNSWNLEPEDPLEDGEGSLVASSAHLDFPPGSNLSPEFVHWRFPVNGSYIVSPPGHPNSLHLASPLPILTGADGGSAKPKGQTFVARRQVHSLFTFSTTFDISTLHSQEAEVGVTVFLDQVGCCEICRDEIYLLLAAAPLGPWNHHELKFNPTCYDRLQKTVFQHNKPGTISQISRHHHSPEFHLS
jgi:hypothetical protein